MIAVYGKHYLIKLPSNRDLVIQSSDRYTSPSAQYGYGIPNFGTAKTLQVAEFDSKYFGIYPNPATDFVTAFPESFNKGIVVFTRF
jgi:hypothetical protein